MSVRAARLIEHGKPLEVQQVELPTPADDEVLVELAYAGVNPVDGYNAAGKVNPDGPLPRTLGGEAAGHLDGVPVVVSGRGLGAVARWRLCRGGGRASRCGRGDSRRCRTP